LTRHLIPALLLCLGAGAVASTADSVGQLRQSGCGRTGLPPLRADRALARAAGFWSQGQTLDEALRRAGYRADAVQALRLEGSEQQVLAQLRARACSHLRDASLQDYAVFQRDRRSWILLARPYRPPDAADSATVAAEVLQLTNRERARGRRCGDRTMAPVSALRLSPVLATSAGAHAREMARLDHLEHRGADGSTAADRARAAGYRPRLVGENIAVGAETADEVVQGWLDSPGHCLNLMNAGFAEMGLAYADGGAGSGGVYWVQLFGTPLER